MMFFGSICLFDRAALAPNGHLALVLNPTPGARHTKTIVARHFDTAFPHFVILISHSHYLLCFTFESAVRITYSKQHHSLVNCLLKLIHYNLI